MKKQLDATTIMNELRGQSVFFPTRPSEQNRHVEPQLQQETKSSPPVRDVPPVLPVPVAPLERDVRPVPPKKRIMKQRHPFDIYHDPYDTLKQFAEEERRQGGIGSMSAMVREAIDKFIATQKRKGK